MTFLRAVGRFYGRYAQFGGRAGRAEFWWVVLYLSLASLGITLLFGALGADTTTAAPSAVVFPGFAVSGLSVPAVDSMTEAYQAFSGVWGLLHLVPAWALLAPTLGSIAAHPAASLRGETTGSAVAPDSGTRHGDHGCC